MSALLLLNLTSLNLTVAVKLEPVELVLRVDGVVGAGLPGDGLQQPVQALVVVLRLRPAARVGLGAPVLGLRRGRSSVHASGGLALGQGQGHADGCGGEKEQEDVWGVRREGERKDNTGRSRGLESLLRNVKDIGR